MIFRAHFWLVFRAHFGLVFRARFGFVFGDYFGLVFRARFGLANGAFLVRRFQTHCANKIEIVAWKDTSVGSTWSCGTPAWPEDIGQHVQCTNPQHVSPKLSVTLQPA